MLVHEQDIENMNVTASGYENTRSSKGELVRHGLEVKKAPKRLHQDKTRRAGLWVHSRWRAAATELGRLFGTGTGTMKRSRLV